MKANLNTIFLFLIVFFKNNFAATPEFVNHWVIWNIGQGQWVTHVKSDECRHFDAGGEFGSFKNIKKSILFNCATKLNRIFLSHWDFDHILNIPTLAQSIPHLCWQSRPPFSENKKMVKKIIELELPFCPSATSDVETWAPLKARTSNEASYVYREQNVLIPGDSTLNQEKIWSQEARLITNVDILVLGHHGSRTSTGTELIKNMHQLKMAISSARYIKYHHPHSETLHRIYQNGIPVLKTEDWGNIWIDIN